MENNEVLRDIIEPIYRAKLWMQITGVMLIISGVITALSVVGILVAWVPIWAGVVLMQAAAAADKAYQNGDAREIKHSLSKIKTYFTIFGVLMLIYIILALGALLFTGMFSAGTMMSY